MAARVPNLQSAAQSALGGLRASGERAAQAASDIQRAGLQLHNDTVSISDEARELSQHPLTREQPPELSTSLLKLSEASTAYKANVALLRSLDDMQREGLKIGSR